LLQADDVDPLCYESVGKHHFVVADSEIVARNRICLDWLRDDLENAHAEIITDAEPSV
jgi:hypothetical protein